MVAPLLQECYVMLCLTINHLGTGFVLAYPAVLTPIITKGDGLHATRDEASWIASAYALTGPLGFIILPALMQLYGRRFINVLLNLFTFIGSIIIATAQDVPTLIAGRSIQGISFGALYITSILAAEYSHPKWRGFFTIFKVSASSFGVLICHGFGFSLTWRQMAWLAAIPPALAALGTFKWPESPSWLAYKGRYEDSEAAFEWLRGKDMESRKEIRELITAQKQLRTLDIHDNSLKGFFRIMKRKDFLKPLSILIVLVLLLQVCGRHYLLAYTIEIMAKLTGDRSIAFYFTIGMDLMKIFATILSSCIIRMYNRRFLLFTTGGIAFSTLALMCIFHYQNGIGVPGFKWITPSMLILYGFLCDLGVIPLTIVLKGEMLPLEYRGLGTCIVGIVYSLLSMLTLKLTSTMLIVLDVHGTFAIYICIAVISLLILYFILPETKDRTLQDIEGEFIQLDRNTDEENCDKQSSLIKD